MDEDTLIALGFVVGAALLVAITFVWVIVYCLCCRKQEEEQQNAALAKSRQQEEQFRYLSTTFHPQITQPQSISGSSQSSSRSYPRELPQLPQEVETEPGPRPPIKTPDEERPKIGGLANPGFITSMESMYAYCDEIPSYPAPDIPESRDRPQLRSQPSCELLFLEKKYNIKADDTDDIHNSRPLTKYNNTSFVCVSPSPAEGQDGLESYADVNNILRSFSIMEPDEKSEPVQMQTRSNDHGVGELNSNQNANVNQLYDNNKLKLTSIKITKSVFQESPEQDKSLVGEQSVSNTMKQRSQLKEIEEISFDTQDISPNSTIQVNSSPMEIVDNMTYFSTLDFTAGQICETDTLPICAESLTSLSEQSTLADTFSTSSSMKPTPKPRHSRSTSMDTMIIRDDVIDEPLSDYTNIPPLPKPRLSQPPTLERRLKP